MKKIKIGLLPRIIIAIILGIAIGTIFRLRWYEYSLRSTEFSVNFLTSPSRSLSSDWSP